MELCPICRARLSGATTCRRCRAELGQAQAAEQAARNLEGAAMLRLAEGEFEEASQILRRGRLLHSTLTIRSLCRLGRASERDGRMSMHRSEPNRAAHLEPVLRPVSLVPSDARQFEIPADKD